MIRGTNAQFKFNMPYKFSELLVAEITFWQDGHNGEVGRPLPIIKVLGQCSEGKDPYELVTTLNAEETLRFTDELKGKVQLRAKTLEAHSFASKETRFTVYPIYDDSVIEDYIEPTPEYNGYVILDAGEVK